MTKFRVKIHSNGTGGLSNSKFTSGSCSGSQSTLFFYSRMWYCHISSHWRYLCLSDIKARYIWLIIILAKSSSFDTFLPMTLTQLTFVFSTLAVFLMYWMNGESRRRSLPPGAKSTLWLEAFFQCPAHSNGRRIGIGEKSTVRNASGSRLWSSAQ